MTNQWPGAMASPALAGGDTGSFEQDVRPVAPIRVGVLVDVAARKLGSMEDWLVALTERLRGRGHDVTVFTRAPVHPEIVGRLRRARVPWVDLAELEAEPLSAVRRLARFDLLHLSLFAHRSRVALAAYAAWPCKVLFVDQFSGSFIDELDQDAPRGVVRTLVDRATLVRVAGVAGVSGYVTERTRRRFRLARGRLRTIHNGVDIERFQAWPGRAQAAVPTFLAAANLIREKGIHVLLEAVRQLPRSDFRLEIVGEGPQEPILRAASERLGLADRVEFLGLRNDLPARLANADVYVHPAIWREACAFTIAEAMASACAIVASRVGGIPEQLVDGESGMLVAPNDPGALAAAMDMMLSDPSLRARLGAAARRRACDLFTLDRCVEAHVMWCESVAGVRNASPRGAG